MSGITATFYKQQDQQEQWIESMQTSLKEGSFEHSKGLANINKEWQKEVIDKQNGNTYQSAMMAPTVATT
jgi:hypothetical protein